MEQQITGINAHIYTIMNSLTKAEKKIAEYVLAEPEKTIYASITDLANEIHVGESTIIRFCRKLGFQSYQTFKLNLGQDLTNNKNSKLSELDIEIKEDDSIGNLIEKTLNINVCALHETLTLIDEKELQRAIDLIASSEKVFFCGAGVSEVTAQDAAYRLMRIGVNSIIVNNHHFQRMQASLLSEKDIVIAFSHSGATKDVNDIINIAKGGGAKIISITHNRHSPMTQLADVVLVHGSKHNLLQGGALSSKMCQLMIVDILYNGLFQIFGSDAVYKKNSTLKSILERLIQ